MRFFLVASLIVVSLHVHAQDPSDISESEVSRIEKVLASDDMQGRQVFKPGIEKAAAFIRNEFKKTGLKPLPGASDFNQHFTMINPVFSEATAVLDNVTIDPKNLIAFSADTDLTITAGDHYSKVIIKDKKDFSVAIFKYLESNENVILLIDTSLSKRFSRLASFHAPQFKGSGNRIFILTAADPQTYDIRIKQKISEQELTNLVGMIPGKTRPDEYVIFSAHYDHLGIGEPNAAGDSVFNGANDDASGTTAVIMLAKYFSKVKSNNRSLIFAAFTAEEIGEFGSAYFSKQLDPSKVMAMFNIEMIGTESKWGRNSAYITGFDKSNMGDILQKNLLNSPFKFYPDPYPEQQLFLRSDNATLAKLGVPAHSISTSKMDSDKYYHQLGDEVSTLDLKNMTEIIRAIPVSAQTIIAGIETPRRVIPE
jgi:Peptidase family M28